MITATQRQSVCMVAILLASCSFQWASAFLGKGRNIQKTWRIDNIRFDRLTMTPSSFSYDLMAVLEACLAAGAKAAAEAMREAATAIFMVKLVVEIVSSWSCWPSTNHDVTFFFMTGARDSLVDLLEPLRHSLARELFHVSTCHWMMQQKSVRLLP